ncbi:MAG: GNAT family N-acetyltransferase [Persicimonas sp.]
MAIFRVHSSSSEWHPQLLGEEHRARICAFLSKDVPLNLFQLSWLDNHQINSKRCPQAYHFAGVFDAAGKLRAVALVVTDRLLLVHADHEEAAAALGRWYRDRELRLEHVVSGRSSVEPFWRAYSTPEGFEPVAARLNRSQKLYRLDRRRWHEEIHPRGRPRFEPTGVERANLDQIEALFLASARMHREETLEDPLQTQPSAFRRHVRHRIQARRTFAWFDSRKRLLFKADLSALSSYGAQVSGVYTPPPLRGRGIATRAVFDICEELFESGLPRMTLYVNADNQPARRVYQKVGFQFHADYQTVFVQPPHQQ